MFVTFSYVSLCVTFWILYMVTYVTYVTYINSEESRKVRFDEVVDPFRRPGESASSDQEDEEDDVRQSSGNPHGLGTPNCITTPKIMISKEL